MTKFTTTLAAIIIACFHCTNNTIAQTTNWTDAAGDANFLNADNWDNGAPDSQTTANLFLPQAYTVKLPEDAQVDEVQMSRGEILFNGGFDLVAERFRISDGLFTVSDENTRFATDGFIAIGNEIGQATMLVQNGASLFSNDLVTIINDSQLHIDNAELTTAEFWMGSLGGEDVTVIEGGADVFAINSYIGGVIGGPSQDVFADSTLTVHQPGTTWDGSQGTLHLGARGLGKLNVSQSAELFTSVLIAGFEQTGTGEINVNNNGRLITDIMILGGDGQGILDVASGGSVEVESDCSLGTSSESTVTTQGTLDIGGELICDGSITINTMGSVNVAESASVTSMTIQDGLFSSAGLQISHLLFAPGGQATEAIINGPVEMLPGSTLNTLIPFLTFNDDFSATANLTVLTGDSSTNITFKKGFVGSASFSNSANIEFQGDVEPGNGDDPTGSVLFTFVSACLSGSTLNIQIEGSDLTQYDRLAIIGNGDLTLSNASLNIELLNNFTPEIGQTFTIVASVSQGIQGEFVGLPEGSIVGTFGDVDLQISYVGGNGDDIVLTATENKAVNLGDVNLDGAVNLLDVAPFVERVSTGTFQVEADVNQDDNVNLLDVSPFVGLLTGV